MNVSQKDGLGYGRTVQSYQKVLTLRSDSTVQEVLIIIYFKIILIEFCELPEIYLTDLKKNGERDPILVNSVFIN